LRGFVTGDPLSIEEEKAASEAALSEALREKYKQL
jgi:hypothetical protein